MPSATTQGVALIGAGMVVGGIVAIVAALLFAGIAVNLYQQPNPLGVHDAQMHSMMVYTIVSALLGAAGIKVGKDVIKSA
jgi:hypothetical protein